MFGLFGKKKALELNNVYVAQYAVNCKVVLKGGFFMANSRTPGPFGLNPFHLSPLTLGPLGDAPRGLIGDTPGTLGIHDYADPNMKLKLSPYWEPQFPALSLSDYTLLLYVSKDDEAEFNLLKGKITDTSAAQYVQHRTAFFGSTAAYKALSVESDCELNATKRLRRLIELKEKPEAQTIFYRWVRKAYMDNGVEDVPGLIRRRESEELRQALAKVEVSYTKGFTRGGFNPRPKKDSNYRYRLGTISEHGEGDAVDIEAKKNPILSIKDWKFIEKLTGKTVDRSSSRWKKNPKALWQDMKDLNNLFVTKVASEIKRVQDAQKIAKPPEADAKLKDKEKHRPEPIDVVLSGHVKLKESVNGFFTIEWDLVEQLHIHGFRWGATFSNAVDLHHFEVMK